MLLPSSHGRYRQHRLNQNTRPALRREAQQPAVESEVFLICIIAAKTNDSPLDQMMPSSVNN